jgi:hypothetical protein
MCWFVFRFWRVTFPTGSLIDGVVSTKDDDASYTVNVVESSPIARILPDHSASPGPFI